MSTRSTRRTTGVLPLASSPVRTTTASSFFRCMTNSTGHSRWNASLLYPWLHYFRRETQNAGKIPIAQFPGHSPKDARPARVLFGVEEDHGIAVKPHVGAVVAPRRLLAAHDDAADHV